MPPVWFEKKREKSGFIGFVKPVAWQGWVVHLAMVFLFALLAQLLGRWALVDGFRPLGMGIWYVAGMFILFGFYFRIVTSFSGTRE